MAAYFQMGHDTENLVGEKDLEDYSGIILSPVNRDKVQLKTHISEFRKKGDYDIIFDSQLYFPRSERGFLPQQPYFPSDFDTADFSSNRWWNKLLDDLIVFVEKLKVDAIASPVMIPKIWNDDYYFNCTERTNLLAKKLSGSDIRVLSTVIVNLNQLSNLREVMKVSSIVSNTKADGYYLVVVSDIDPRRELSDPEELFGLMNLIKELENSGKSVLVSHCASEMLLYKVAGATHCSTGKFFNLRRFTKSRYDEPLGGGGQLPYWFEHGLLTFLREADIKRLQKSKHKNILETEFSKNIWSKKILENLDKSSGKPWLALGWRQYLSWFGKTESFLANSKSEFEVKKWLKQAEENWILLEEDEILFEEPKNNGTWIRKWRQTVIDFSKLS